MKVQVRHDHMLIEITYQYPGDIGCWHIVKALDPDDFSPRPAEISPTRPGKYTASTSLEQADRLRSAVAIANFLDVLVHVRADFRDIKVIEIEADMCPDPTKPIVSISKPSGLLFIIPKQEE